MTIPPSTDPVPAWLRPWLDRLAVNRAVAYLLAARVWQCGSYVVTLYLLLSRLDDVQRGYYTVIYSWLAMQVFAELGLPIILTILASHEASKLEWQPDGRLTGDQRALSRLASLERFSCWWFGCASILFLLLVGSAGLERIGNSRDHIDWHAPWLAAIAINAISLFSLPAISLLEGCQQVVAVNRLRLAQAITGSLVVWACLLGGAGLWFIAASNLVRTLWEIWLVYGTFGQFFTELRSVPVTERVNLREEILPLQWRAAIQNVAGYFSNPFLTLLVDRVDGKIAAGQMGLTWQALNMIRDIAFVWIQTRLPQMSSLAATGERALLWRVWWHCGLVSTAAFLAGCGAFCLFVLGLSHLPPPWNAPFLPLAPTSLLILGLTALLIAGILQMYVRIHKQDPYVWVNTVGALFVGWLCTQLGGHYGLWGMASGYAAVLLLFTLPTSFYYWWKLRIRQRLEH